jgi:hypothetical protein
MRNAVVDCAEVAVNGMDIMGQEQRTVWGGVVRTAGRLGLERVKFSRVREAYLSVPQRLKPDVVREGCGMPEGVP